MASLVNKLVFEWVKPSRESWSIYVYHFCFWVAHCLLQDIHFVELDIRDMTDPKNKTEKMRVPILLPHELLNFLSASQCKLALLLKQIFLLFVSTYIDIFVTFAEAMRPMQWIRTIEASDKINVQESDKAVFWNHFRSHSPHVAIDEHDRHPKNRWHQPIGLSGDDARYTLAGRKIIVMMLSSVLQTVKRYLCLNGNLLFFFGGVVVSEYWKLFSNNHYQNNLFFIYRGM